MCDRCGEADVSHSLTSDRCACDLDLALVADESLSAHTHIALALVLAAVALEVACGSEDAFAEKPIALWS